MTGATSDLLTFCIASPLDISICTTTVGAPLCGKVLLLQVLKLQIMNFVAKM